MSRGIIRIQFDRATEFSICSSEVKIIGDKCLAKRRVGFAQRVVQFQRSQGGGFGFRQTLFWASRGKSRHQDISVGQTGVSQGKAGIFVDGLLKIPNSGLEIRRGAFVPKVPAFKIEVVRSVLSVGWIAIACCSEPLSLA